MAFRVWRPPSWRKVSARNKTGTRLRQLLDQLREQEKYKDIHIDIKQYNSDPHYRYGIWSQCSPIWEVKPPKQPKFRPCRADDYQRFKKDFVDEYGGEKVQETGMTHKEFLDWFKNGRREGIEDYDERHWV